MPEPAGLIAQFVSADEKARDSALGTLSDLAADYYDEEAANLAALIRDAGGIAVLVTCMESPAIDTQQCAMSLLGNLLTDVFDSQARESLRLFAAADGLPSLQTKLTAEYPLNLFATAALQNVTALDPEECCATLRDMGADKILTEIVSNEQVSRASALTPSLFFSAARGMVG